MSKKLILFTGQFCGPCKVMKPILRELVQERGIDLQEYELETHGKTIFADNGIRSVPTMIVMSDEKEVSRVLGGQSRAQLESLFDKWGL